MGYLFPKQGLGGMAIGGKEGEEVVDGHSPGQPLQHAGVAGEKEEVRHLLHAHLLDRECGRHVVGCQQATELPVASSMGGKNHAGGILVELEAGSNQSAKSGALCRFGELDGTVESVYVGDGQPGVTAFDCSLDPFFR
jgi:hypothetical protein